MEISRKLRNAFSPFVAIVLCVVAFVRGGVAADRDDEFFENRIRPVLATTCVQCHGEQRSEGGLRLDSRDALLRGGDSGKALDLDAVATSLLIRAISRHEDVSAMPPEKEKALRADQIADFQTWVSNGVHWPASSQTFVVEKHWAFGPVKKSQPKQGSDSAWDHNEIDSYIRHARETVGAAPAAPADKLTLIRRATYDLTGLPPTLEEIASFEEDHSESAFATVVDRLLRSPAYGERWGRHWLDVVRYADTAGETADYPVPTAWKYRDYVIQAFNADKPYDQFLREQIAGDVLANQNENKEHFAEQTIATGYMAISRRFGFDSENYHHLTIQDTIDNVGQTVLGLSLGCARCHDHKFDPVPMRDYYGLYGIFDSSRYAFPGSEQKQRLRCLVPLSPSEVSQPKFREYEAKVALISGQLAALKQPVPQAALRSLHDMDGDFEVQAPAAGGSNGVLVPPWIYRGKIAVTNAAQSPYQNLFPRGKVGASIPSGTEDYRIEQSLLPYWQSKPVSHLFANLDFRPTNSDTTGNASHQLWIGKYPSNALLKVNIQNQSLSLQSAESGGVGPTAPVVVNQWHNLQLQIDFANRTITGTLHCGDKSFPLNSVAIPADWNGIPNRVALESVRDSSETIAAMEYDNLSVQETAIALATTEIALPAENKEQIDVPKLQEQLQSLVGFDRGFEFQTEGQAPAEPWGPGPNSVVKILKQSQSPIANTFPQGELGIFMPNRGEYDGFGRTLPKTWKGTDTDNVYATFDFRCASVDAGGDGSWRYYLGHGPGLSAAVELFINGKSLFRRNAEAREPVCDIQVGQWYQVRLALDLKSKSYRGTIASSKDTAATTPFEGAFPAAWDGTIDYTFIDSYGHIGGVRPALDADNYWIHDSEIALKNPTELEQEKSGSDARQHVGELRSQIRKASDVGAESQAELQQLIIQGPYPMAYAMAEGTPHAVRIQKRGEPDQLGDEVPRSFIRALGNNIDESSLHGSGRLDFANWLASPNNPLTARVMVNRIWQNHFGEGLVKTPNDFGVRGMPPTHPELLDFLADTFVSNGWSIKHMHRLIMNSATYQQSTEADRTQGDIGAEAMDKYTHFARRRLSAEEIRDSILLVSGSLNRSPSTDHPFPSPTSWGFSQHGPFIAVYDHDRRSVYLMTQRIKRHPFLALFDGADPNASTAKRLQTTVPTQALYFLNDPFVHAKATAIAASIVEENENSTERIRRVFEKLLSRSPTVEEVESATFFLKSYTDEIAAGQPTTPTNKTDIQAISALVRTLIGSNEFLHLD